MSRMLKPNDRKISNENMEKFLSNIINESNFVVDIFVHSRSGNCIYNNVPCTVSMEKNYPNDENSYSLNVWWSKADTSKGNPPAEGFPNYPCCTEYKTYFNLMQYHNGGLEFRNIWHDEMVIYIFLKENSRNNIEKMKELMDTWSR